MNNKNTVLTALNELKAALVVSAKIGFVEISSRTPNENEYGDEVYEFHIQTTHNPICDLMIYLLQYQVCELEGCPEDCGVEQAEFCEIPANSRARLVQTLEGNEVWCYFKLVCYHGEYYSLPENILGIAGFFEGISGLLSPLRTLLERSNSTSS